MTIKNIIAIASGKGGVGKSTTAVNLALALKAENYNVGILDADIYGPSQPLLLGVNQKPETKDNKLVPIEKYGIHSMSMGYLVEANTPMVWRGPMMGTALQQLFRDTDWGELDYLVIDLPPGTGDIQLTLAQKITVNGVVIVTTPQDIALIDARKAYEMFRKVHVPVVGIIENMSTHICSACGHVENIFSSGGGEKMAETLGIPLLGQLPLDMTIREQSDKGMPIVIAEPTHIITKNYMVIAKKIIEHIDKNKKAKERLSKISVQDK